MKLTYEVIDEIPKSFIKYCKNESTLIIYRALTSEELNYAKDIIYNTSRPALRVRLSNRIDKYSMNFTAYHSSNFFKFIVEFYRFLGFKVTWKIEDFSLELVPDDKEIEHITGSIEIEYEV